MSGFTDERSGLEFDAMGDDYLTSGGGNTMTGDIRFSNSTYKIILAEGTGGEGQIYVGDQGELWFYKPNASATETKYLKFFKLGGVSVTEGAQSGTASYAGVKVLIGGAGGGDTYHTH